MLCLCFSFLFIYTKDGPRRYQIVCKRNVSQVYAATWKRTEQNTKQVQTYAQQSLTHSPTRPSPTPRSPPHLPNLLTQSRALPPPLRPQEGSHSLLAGAASQRYPVQWATEPADWAASRRQLGCQCASPAGHSASKLASQLGQSSQGQPRPAQLVSRPAGQLASRPPNQPASRPAGRSDRRPGRPCWPRAGQANPAPEC